MPYVIGILAKYGYMTTKFRVHDWSDHRVASAVAPAG